MGSSWQEYWRGMPCPPPRGLPDPGIQPESPLALALKVDSLPQSWWESPCWSIVIGTVYIATIVYSATKCPQQSDWVIHIHVSTLFQILFPFSLLQNMEQSSLCYTVGLAIIYCKYNSAYWWRRKWQSTPVFLPGESQGQRSLAGCRLWGCRVRHDWSDLATAAACIGGFSGGSLVKSPPVMQKTPETWVPSLGWEDPWRRALQPSSLGIFLRNSRNERLLVSSQIKMCYI